MYQSYITIQVINFSANLIQLTMKFQFQTNLEEFFITIYTQVNVNPCLPQDYVGIVNQLLC